MALSALFNLITTLDFYRHLDLHSLHVNYVGHADLTHRLHKMAYIHVKAHAEDILGYDVALNYLLVGL
jgi:hypothetical protein